MALTKCPECNKEVSSQATTCPHCGYPLTAAQGKTAPASPATPPPNSKPKMSKFKLGCLGLLAVFGIFILILIIIGTIIPGEPVNIQGTTGHMEHALLAETITDAEDDIASAVYETATKHPALKELTLTLDLATAGGLVDKYGNAVPGPYIMGDITITNLDEVRKYAGWTEYLRQYQADYYIQIKSLKYSDQLEDK